MFTLGRIIAGLISKFVENKKLIFSCLFLALLGILLLVSNSGELITIFGISLAGFSVAPIFPSMVSNTSYRVGIRHHTNAIGLQMSSAGFGMAIIPSLGGIFAKNFELEIIPVNLFVILLFVLIVFSYLNIKYK